MKARRILLTGATGFVGRRLVPHLLAAKEQLTLAVRSADACPASWRGDDRIRIVDTGPIERAGDLGAAFSGVSRVVHMAGLAHVAGGGERMADTFMSANTAATARLAEAAAAAGEVATFIHLGSLAAVTANASDAIVADGSEGKPVTPYGRSKRLAEAHVEELAAGGTFAVTLRPPLIVGAEAKGNWRALQRLAATGAPLPFASVRNRRSLIGVDELVRALALLCTRDWPPQKSGNYCLAASEPVSLAAMVSELRAGMGLPPRLFPCPPSLLRALARLANRQEAAASLLGDLVVDSGRFRRTFGVEEMQGIKSSIRASGADYRQSHF